MTAPARRDTFQAIADPTRRNIISLLAQQPLNLNSIAEKFDVSRPAISQHIRVLIECGLIVIHQKGRERFCYVQPAKLNEVSDWLTEFRKLWEHRFSKLDDLLIEMQKTTKSTKKTKSNDTHKRT